MNTQFDGSVEDTVVAADGELVDVDAQLVDDKLDFSLAAILQERL